MVCDLNQQTFDGLMNSPVLTKLMTLWSSFLKYLSCDNGELSAYWMSYIDMVENVILGLLHGSREGNWNLHLNTVRSMIPWCFAQGGPGLPRTVLGIPRFCVYTTHCLLPTL